MVNTQRRLTRQDDRSRERALEDYVKAIYHLSGQAPVRAVDVARHLGVSRASVTKSRYVLERAGLVRFSRKRSDALHLTPKGLELAVNMVRRHRLVETFLHRELRVPLERVHADAEKIEHTISDDIAGRLAHFLGNPQTDPHGHPIPLGHKTPVPVLDIQLHETHRGDCVIITALDDRDDASLKDLSSHRILPGLRFTVDDVSPDGVYLRAGRRRLMLSRRCADAVRCVRVGRG